MTPIWTGPARSDLIDILEFIAADDPSAAARTIDRIESAALALAAFPLSGRVGAASGTRELLVRGLPFLLIYRVRDTSVEILRVLHGARRWPPD